MSGSGVLNFLGLKKQSTVYSDVFGWNWDGKVHAREVIAQSVDHFWTIVGPSVMLCDRTSASHFVTEGMIYSWHGTWRMKVNDVVVVLPVGSVIPVTVGVIIYHVLQIPCFVELPWRGQKKSVICCIGTSKSRHNAVFAIDVNDPFLNGLDCCLALSIDAETGANVPSYPGYSPDSPVYAPSSPSYVPSMENEDDDSLQAKIVAVKKIIDGKPEVIEDPRPVQEESGRFILPTTQELEVKELAVPKFFKKAHRNKEAMLNEHLPLSSELAQASILEGKGFKYDLIDGKRVLDISAGLRLAKEQRIAEEIDQATYIKNLLKNASDKVFIV